MRAPWKRREPPPPVVVNWVPPDGPRPRRSALAAGVFGALADAGLPAGAISWWWRQPAEQLDDQSPRAMFIHHPWRVLEYARACAAWAREIDAVARVEQDLNARYAGQPLSAALIHRVGEEAITALLAEEGIRRPAGVAVIPLVGEGGGMKLSIQVAFVPDVEEESSRKH